MNNENTCCGMPTLGQTITNDIDNRIKVITNEIINLPINSVLFDKLVKHREELIQEKKNIKLVPQNETKEIPAKIKVKKTLPPLNQNLLMKL